MLIFHERHAGKVSAVSDNTRNRRSRRGIISSSPPTMGGTPLSTVVEDCQIMGGDSPFSIPNNVSSPVIVEDVCF